MVGSYKILGKPGNPSCLRFPIQEQCISLLVETRPGKYFCDVIIELHSGINVMGQLPV